MENTNKEDWSARHIRLRFELIASALLIAAYAVFDAKPETSLLIPVDFKDIKAGWVIAILLVFYFATLLHYWVRTKTEMMKITDASAQITEKIGMIVSANDDLKAAFKLPEAAVVEPAIRDLTASLYRDRDVIRQLHQLTPKIERILSMPCGGERSNAVDDLLTNQRVDTAVEVIASADTAILRASARIDELRGKLDALAAYYDKELPSLIEAANAKRSLDLSALDNVKNDLTYAKDFYTWERIRFSCWLPAGVSLLLVVISLGKMSWGYLTSP